MPQYEGTVDEFKAEAANMSDEELEGYAADDDRAGIADAANSELASRNGGDSSESGAPAAGDEAYQKALEDKNRKSLLRPENEEGVNLDPDVGQNEVQAKVDEMEISGVNPPTGGPPSKEHTVQGVTNTLDPEDDTREAAEEAFEQLHGRAPGDPVV